MFIRKWRLFEFVYAVTLYTCQLYIFELYKEAYLQRGVPDVQRNPNLPLTETTFYILLVLNNPSHGYGIIQKIDRLSDGDVKVAAGTMYGAIEHLLKLNWIEEIPSPDKRRRVYQITNGGKAILSLESQRLKKLSALATQFE